jgi:hypothetical protein
MQFEKWQFWNVFLYKVVRAFFLGDTMREGLTLIGVFLEGTTPTR